jgi:hypothetical protein
LKIIQEKYRTDGIHFPAAIFAKTFTAVLFHEYGHAWMDSIKFDEEFYAALDEIIAVIEENYELDTYSQSLMDKYKNDEANKEHNAKEIVMEIFTANTTLNDVINYTYIENPQLKIFEHDRTKILLATLNMYSQYDKVQHNPIYITLFSLLEK